MTRWEAETLLYRYEHRDADDHFLFMPYDEPVPHRYQETGVAESPSNQIRSESSHDVTGSSKRTELTLLVDRGPH